MVRQHRFRHIAKSMGILGCVLALVMWGVSLFVGVSYYVEPEGSAWEFGVYDGLAYGYRHRRYYPMPFPQGCRVDRPTGYRSYGLELAWIDLRIWKGCVGLYLPLWVLSLMFALFVGYLHRNGLRRSVGHCRSCDYNLTGNTSGICPECGTPVTTGCHAHSEG